MGAAVGIATTSACGHPEPAADSGAMEFDEPEAEPLTIAAAEVPVGAGLIVQG